MLIYEVATGRERARLLHDDRVDDVVFSATGRYIAVANGGKISIWEWMQGREVARLRHDGLVTAIAFTPDDSRLVSASQDKSVRVWAWQAADLVADACSRLERNLTREEWKSYLGQEDYRATCPSLPMPEK